MGPIGIYDLAILLAGGYLIWRFVKKGRGRTTTFARIPPPDREPTPKSPSEEPTPALPSVDQAQSPGIRLDPERKRVQVAAEIINVPKGVTITVKRARTIEHAVSMNWRSTTKAELGIQQVVKATIQKEIERSSGRTYQEREAVEYQIELNGQTSRRYKLTWVDVFLTGTSNLSNAGVLQSVAFEFREQSELEVVPADDLP